ncbi:MAG: hypothetical protein K2J20_00415 [Bacilli bacterium]|nr:hypothetical protein [Bacilli bacterium]
MTLEEITIILEKIKRTEDLGERFKLVNEYWDIFRSSYLNIHPSNWSELKRLYPNELCDFKLLGKAHYTEEERERRRQAAQNRPKYTPTEETIMQIFHENFSEDLHWLKSRKDLSKLRKNGINIMPSKGDSNICEGHHYIRQGMSTVYTFCCAGRLPYFEIWLDDNKEGIFLYLQKAAALTEENNSLNQKALKFLIDIQRTFAKRTPDTIYLASLEDWEENGRFLWAETSKTPGMLINYTDRITSGCANIVSISAAAKANIAQSSLYANSIFYAEQRNINNGTPETIEELNAIRTSFDKAFENEEKPMIRNRVTKGTTSD